MVCSISPPSPGEQWSGSANRTHQAVQCARAGLCDVIYCRDIPTPLDKRPEPAALIDTSVVRASAQQLSPSQKREASCVRPEQSVIRRAAVTLGTPRPGGLPIPGWAATRVPAQAPESPAGLVRPIHACRRDQDQPFCASVRRSSEGLLPRSVSSMGGDHYEGRPSLGKGRKSDIIHYGLSYNGKRADRQ